MAGIHINQSGLFVYGQDITASDTKQNTQSVERVEFLLNVVGGL